jgi:hypothetical protein
MKYLLSLLLLFITYYNLFSQIKGNFNVEIFNQCLYEKLKNSSRLDSISKVCLHTEKTKSGYLLKYIYSEYYIYRLEKDKIFNINNKIHIVYNFNKNSILTEIYRNKELFFINFEINQTPKLGNYDPPTFIIFLKEDLTFDNEGFYDFCTNLGIEEEYKKKYLIDTQQFFD